MGICASGHIQTARVEAVARHQIAGDAIVERNARHVVTRNRNDIDDAVTQIDLAQARRPCGDSGRLLDLGGCCRHKLHVGHLLELTVRGRVIAM